MGSKHGSRRVVQGYNWDQNMVLKGLYKGRNEPETGLRWVLEGFCAIVSIPVVLG